MLFIVEHGSGPQRCVRVSGTVCFVWLAVLLLSACGAASSGAGPVAAVAPPPDDVEALRVVHEFFEAKDGRDAERFFDLVTAEFFLFEEGAVMTAADLAKPWAKSSDAAPTRTRTCTDERVSRSRNVIVYVGDCTEKLPAYKQRPARQWQGWNTVVLVAEAGSWKVGLWQWVMSGAEAERVRWDAVYRSAVGFSQVPNRLLAKTAANLTPGSALVVAMGQGRNALHLAKQGWTVTGVDLSPEGVRIAREAASDQQLQLTAELANLDSYDFGKERWDLVTMIYAGNDRGWIERIKQSIRPGGYILVEYFHTESLELEHDGFQTGELAQLFSGWEILQDEVVEDVADWGLTKAKLVRFVARRP